MKSIKSILISRDKMTPEQADKLIEQAKLEFDRLISEGETDAAYDICGTYFGLEPDYIEEFLN